MAKLIAFVLLLLISPAAYAATTHTVGGLRGWNTGVKYDDWASEQTFATGDSLLFIYDISHTVDEVTEADYQSCSSANPINSYPSSPTTVPLNATGTRYFICPRSNHCSQGMKLTVTVSADGSSPPPSGGASPSPPSGSPETPGTPPSTPSSPPPPAGGGAASILGGRNSLMVGFSLVLAAVVGIMG
ncbi:mavicyanin-like [Sesamum indicum]|uniref:Mavicyanin-like n=1 Tax=Sesamum indicum TaxID=4182 RepID=A0A6I9V278_SESIN|nr:mavicyanin-like [Sesamum indicum]